MPILRGTAVSRIGGLLSLGLGTTLATYGGFLLLVGQRMSTAAESPSGGSFTGSEYIPTPLGTIPLAAGLIVSLGVVAGWRIVAWTGWLLASGYAVATLFGVGAPVLWISLALLVALILWRRPGITRTPRTGVAPEP